MLVLGAVAREDALARHARADRARARDRAGVRATRACPTQTAPSALWRAWRRRPVEAVAVAGARGDRDAARRWIEELRGVRARDRRRRPDRRRGAPRGPRSGAASTRTLERKLDGELAGGREAELADALAGEA